VSGNYPGTKLPDPQGVLSKEVPSPLISTANTKTAAGTKVVRGIYLKTNAEKTQHAAKHRVLAMVWYNAVKLPLTTSTMHICPTGGKLINSGCGLFEQCIYKIISMKFFKTAIRENLDPRNTVFHTKRVEKCFLYILLHFSKSKCPMDMYCAPP